MPGFKCIYLHCPSRTGSNKALFQLPRDPVRCNRWLEAAGREDLSGKSHRSYKLCEDHFESRYFSVSKSNVKRLYDTAIPSIFSGPKRKSHFLLEEPPKKAIILSDVTIKPDGTLIVNAYNDRSVSETRGGPLKSDANEDSFAVASQIPSCSRDTITPPLLSPSATQTSPRFTKAKTENTPRKVRLRYQIKSLRQRLAFTKVHLEKERREKQNRQYFNKLCDKYLTNPLAEIVKVQAILQKKGPKARRYSKEYKNFALTLYFLSPKSYNFLKKLLILPSKRSLELMTQNILCKPGLENEHIFESLKLKAKTMSELDKYCNICIDETSIKSNLFFDTGRDIIIGFEDVGIRAKNALVAQNVAVIMARGLFNNWKQPIAYFFVNTQLRGVEVHDVLKITVQKLSDIGLYVQGVTSDMGSNFIQLANLLNVTPEDPEFALGDFKLVYFFDPPHLQKATKNSLMSNSFHFDDQNTSGSFIERFYLEDKKQPYRCAPKLTDAHIYPTNFQKMKVSLSVQVLSRTVVSGMRAQLELGVLPPEAQGTIEVIEKFDKLFDVLNSIDVSHPNKYKMVFKGSEFQIDFLNDMWKFLDELKIFNRSGRDITSKCKFRRCWMITIKAIQILWQRLSKVGFQYLKTRRINQDCLENYFGNVRQQGGNSVNPTPIQFERTFRKLFCMNFLHSTHMNCENDLDILLVQLKKAKSGVFEKKHFSASTCKAVALPSYDYRKENLIMQNAFSYVCGYLLNNALKIHNCVTCKEFSRETDTVDKTNLFTYFKAYEGEGGDFGNLKSPNEEFIYFIYKLEKVFVELFDDLSIKEGISRTYLNEMQKISFSHPCTNFPLLYVIKLFIRLKIFYTLKFTNRELASSKKADKTQRKLKILSHL